jgi:acyl-homoserine-lactone acylase
MRDLSEACRVLAAWDLRADRGSRGALLFRQLLSVANEGAFKRRLPAAYTPAVAFDPADPVGTPRGLDRSTKALVLGHLARAVEILEEAGIPLDAPLGDWQGVTRRGERIPLHGGPEIEGVFNKIESDFRGAEGYPEVDRWSSSWILAVDLSPGGPRSFGILTYSLSENPDSPHHVDQTRLFSEKRWLRLPFRAADVESATIRVEHVRSGAR